MARVEAEFLDPGRYPFVAEIGTRYFDMDTNWHINNGAMATIFEEGRVRFLVNCLPRDFDPPLRFVAAAVYIDFLAEAIYPDPFTIRHGVSAISQRSWTNAQIAIQNGQICAFCRTVSVVSKDGRAAPLPERLRSAVETYQLAPVA